MLAVLLCLKRKRHTVRIKIESRGRAERGVWSREPAKTSFVRRCAAGGIDNKQYNIMTKAKNITLKGTSKGRSGNQK